MTKLTDLTGERFGRLDVLGRTDNDKKGNSRWLCRCDCKDRKEKIISGYNLTHLITQSCGCLRIEQLVERSSKHGHSQRGKVTRTYTSWCQMLNRCSNPNREDYHYYGGRGITVRNRWMKFENFLEDMGECHEGYSINRIDNNKGYCKENCHWATWEEQARNKQNNLYVIHNGRTQLLIEWSNESGIPYLVLYKRIYCRNWSAEKALATPIRKRRKK